MIQPLQAQLKKLGDRMDDMALRERGLIFVALLVLLYVVAANFLFSPLQTEQATLKKQLQSKHSQTQKLETQLQHLLQQSAADPDKVNRAKLEALQQKLGTIDASLAETTAGLVSPQEMAKLVEQILKKNRRLKLVKVENLGPRPLGAKSEDDEDGQAAAEQSDQSVYQHGTRIQLEGRYVDFVQYLEALEALPWKVFWGQAALQTDDYPISTFTLVLYTLSLREGWIGV
jgi:MSHA biogenesis protein MshJ